MFKKIHKIYKRIKLKLKLKKISKLYFTKDGNLRDDIHIHNKNIPCYYRFGSVYNLSPCSGCIYYGCCEENATPQNQEEIRQRYPKLFDGSIKTRGEYIDYIRHRSEKT